MNILFITDQDIAPLRGGIKRNTHIISRAFMDKYNLKCYLAYVEGFTTCPTSVFNDKIQITDNDPLVQLEEFIVKHEIDIILLQKMLHKKYRILPVLETIARRRFCKLLFALHFSPEYAMIIISIENIVNDIKYGESLKIKAANLCKLAAYPVYKSIKYFQLRNYYKEIYDKFDRVILLSKRFIPIYAQYARIAQCHKLVAISDPVSFEEQISQSEIAEKKQEVLIVSRFEEKQKKLLRALKIWHKIERDKELSDWKLVIVGFGIWEERYKKYAVKLQLKNVSFEGGPKDPLPYYKRASIFMMTSAYEGLGLVLLESQQMGVVPMAFDSFASLHDVIEDGHNGLIIPNADLDAYAERLIWLMKNKNKREEMARNAVESCRINSSENIVGQWVDLFHAVLSKDNLME
jgi:glycosyltransferase involved in cell wall biosynthesis